MKFDWVRALTLAQLNLIRSLKAFYQVQISLAEAFEWVENRLKFFRLTWDDFQLREFHLPDCRYLPATIRLHNLFRRVKKFRQQREKRQQSFFLFAGICRSASDAWILLREKILNPVIVYSYVGGGGNRISWRICQRNRRMAEHAINSKIGSAERYSREWLQNEDVWGSSKVNREVVMNF